jgi:hypothetical protein
VQLLLYIRKLFRSIIQHYLHGTVNYHRRRRHKYLLSESIHKCLKHSGLVPSAARTLLEDLAQNVIETTYIEEDLISLRSLKAGRASGLARRGRLWT